MTDVLGELPLVGPGGEPVDLRRTILSHGVADLPPMFVDEDEPALELTLAVANSRPRTVRLEPGSPGHVAVRGTGRRPGAHVVAQLLAGVRHVLRLDEDLSPFYASIAADDVLAWAAAGAGRLVRSTTVFEDVVKTICTTNCAWSATERMVGALVANLGSTAAGAPREGAHGRTFPTPAAMALADDDFYAEVARTGYRGRYLKQLANAVATRALDLEALADPELPDDEAERRLLALPGVGPYAAAHIQLIALGRYRPLILDSWTRPKYARLIQKGSVNDAAITRRFRRYGPWAGLAFWLFVTQDWV